MDDELQDLLDQLSDEPEEQNEPEVEKPTQEIKAEIVDDDCQQCVDEMTQLVAAQPQQPIAAAPEQPMVDMAKQFERNEAVSNEVLQSCRSDRQQLQDFINICMNRIQTASNGGAEPPRVYVESIVKAMEVKSNVNDTMLKTLDTTTKLLAATKAGVQIINSNTVTGGDADLEAVLAEPMKPDEEY